VYDPATEIERAMMGYEAVSASIGGREPGAKATAAHLRARASAAYAGYQATRYDDTGRMLPALIRETEAAGGTTGKHARYAPWSMTRPRCCTGSVSRASPGRRPTVPGGRLNCPAIPSSRPCRRTGYRT
jgi:hypothetical protein